MRCEDPYEPTCPCEKYLRCDVYSGKLPDNWDQAEDPETGCLYYWPKSEPALAALPRDPDSKQWDCPDDEDRREQKRKEAEAEQEKAEAARQAQLKKQEEEQRRQKELEDQQAAEDAARKKKALEDQQAAEDAARKKK